MVFERLGQDLPGSKSPTALSRETSGCEKTPFFTLVSKILFRKIV